MAFGSWVRIPPSIIINVYDFPHVELDKLSPRYNQEMKPLGHCYVRQYIRRTRYPAISGGESVVRLTLGRQWVHLLRVVQRTDTPLIQ